MAHPASPGASHNARTRNQPPLMSGRKPDRKKELMKLNTLAKTVVLGLAVLLATGAFASTNKGSLHIERAVQINGQQIPAGDYSVRWEGAGPNVEVSVMRGRKEIAKTSAKVVELNDAPNGDEVVLANTNGTPSVSQLRFNGKKTALDIGSSDQASMAGGAGK